MKNDRQTCHFQQLHFALVPRLLSFGTTIRPSRHDVTAGIMLRRRLKRTMTKP
ncbi:hypothetical protein [Hallella bergensis]|uniref:hypothetical protein n=1 Tax=Hallella bergensis TaxID=242750 RepID=UPI003990BC66